MRGKQLIFLTFMVIACTSAPPFETYRNYIGSWSPDGKQILFYSDRNGNWDVFLINADGTELKQITSAQSNETEPNWHPDGKSFVLASDAGGERKVHSYDLETSHTKLLTDFPGKQSSPAWSPTGSHLTYLSQAGETWELVVKPASDTTRLVLYRGSTYPGRPTWSPLGDAVMYSIAVDSIETLHLANLDGKTVTTYSTGFNSTGNAVISPDGQHIAFDAHSEDILDSGDGKWEIFIMGIDDKNIVRLTTNDKDDWGPRWSPDGTKISFLGGGGNNTGYELFVLDLREMKSIQLTDKTKPN